MMPPQTVAVVGATGFVGSEVVHALESQGHRVIPVRAPRLGPIPRSAARTVALDSPVVDELAAAFAQVDAVVNAAGNPDASETDEDALNAANGVVPGILAAAVTRAGGLRLVHISSAVVQGRRHMLDASREREGFSSYARSKILGEELVEDLGRNHCIVYRPPSVHAADRRVTRMISRIGSSPLATVARPGDDASPQSLLPNVASAVAYLATCTEQPPAIVTHPSEGITTSSIMTLLSGRRPRQIPRWLAVGGTTLLRWTGRMMPRLAADARRVELLWLGQRQAHSWLTDAGWAPPAGLDAWEALGHTVRGRSTRSEGNA